jgi:hypothetical protein
MPKAAVQSEIPADQHDGAAQGRFMRMRIKKGDFLLRSILLTSSQREKGEKEGCLKFAGAYLQKISILL